MKVLANLKHETSHSVLHVYTDFPSAPSIGTLVMKSDGIVYIYSQMDEITTWRPLNIKAKSYVYTQAAASTSWTITHALGSQNLIYFIYDETGVRQEDAGITFNSDDQITLSFTEAIKGKCVIFAEGDNYSGVSSGESGGTGTGNGNVIAYQFRVTGWTSLALGAVPSGNLTWSSNAVGWTLEKIDETDAQLTHNIGKRPCAHDVFHGPTDTNLSYPTSTLRMIEWVNDNVIKIHGYLNCDDLIFTISFIG